MARSINGLEPAIDFQHCQEDINRIATSIKVEREMLEAAKARGGMTAAAQHSGRIDQLTRDLVTRRAELRRFTGDHGSVEPEDVNREMIAAIESGDWPIPLVEQLYLACRRVLHIEEHLPEAPAAQWH